MVLLLVLASYFIAPSNAHAGSPLSALAATPPTIDGLLSPGEWDSAAQVLVFSGLGNETFYVMNDATNIYLALRVLDPTLSPNDIMEVRFDKAHNGVHDENDDSVQAKPSAFLDRYFHFAGSSGSFGNLDPLQNGSSAATGNGATNFFEISHPLNSGDIRDIDASPGDTLGFCLTYFKEGTATSSTMYPTNCLAADVNLGVNEQQIYGDIIIAMAPVPVTVTIIRFIQDQNPDPAPDTTGEFYARVSIGGPPFQDNREDALNATDISPFWTFTRQVNASLGVVPVEIQILDADLLDPDDVMDISPGNQTSVTLSLNLNTCTWTGASGANVGFSQGTSGRILFDVGCTSNGDVDLDGIPDGVERFGVLNATGAPVASIQLQGADPCRKNVLVEIDFMENATATHTHRPKQEALDMVKAAFDNAPVNSVGASMCPYAGFPAKTFGIGLIIDVDDPIQERATITFQQVVPTADLSFEDARDANFDFAKAPYFRYSLWVHDLEVNTTASGIGELSGNDFIVSLGSWTNQTGTVLQQAGTLMHELGHTLGLDHGGGDPNNFKPNYLSVMSYVFQTVGVLRANGTGVMDYSRIALPQLDETLLNENLGIQGTPLLLTRWSCPQAETRNAGRADRPLDWNCDGTFTTPVEADINEDRVCITAGRDGVLNSNPEAGDVIVGSTIQDGGDRLCSSSVVLLSDDFQARIPGTSQPNLLDGFQDWSNLNYVFRVSSTIFDPGKSNLPRGKSNLPRGEELTFEQAQRIEAFWREVSLGVPFYQGSSVQTFYTDTKMNPLPLDGKGNPKVDVVLANGVVKSTNPGQVLAWVNITNTHGPRQSLTVNETLPVDWTAHPDWLPANGAIHVFFDTSATTLTTMKEITQPSTITLVPGNPEVVILRIPDFSATAIGRPLQNGESILLEVKMDYAPAGTSQPANSYPRNATDTAGAALFEGANYTGSSASGSSSGFFTAYAKVVGDVDGNFAVDILDAALLAYSYGSSPGTARWNANADFDYNGTIDILDAAQLAFYYGTSS